MKLLKDLIRIKDQIKTKIKRYYKVRYNIIEVGDTVVWQAPLRKAEVEEICLVVHIGKEKITYDDGSYPESTIVNVFSILYSDGTVQKCYNYQWFKLYVEKI